LATRGVPRERVAISVVPAASIRMPRISAERFTITLSSSSV